MRSLRHLLLTLTILLVSASAQAQVQDLLSEFWVGAGGGYTMSKASFSPSVRQKNLGGMEMGIAGRYICERYFGMTCGAQVEVNLSQWGWSEFYQDYPDLSYESKQKYVSVPFLAHLAFGKPQGFQFFLHLGPEVGFYLGESHKIDGPWTSYESLVTMQHGKDVENKFDYGITGGAGVEMHFKKNSIQLEGRYYYALSDFYKNTKKDYFSRSAHNIITVKLTYMYRL